MTRSFAQRAAALLGFGLVALSSARAETCHLSIGVVMELTGTAGAYGQAAAKAITPSF